MRCESNAWHTAQPHLANLRAWPPAKCTGVRKETPRHQASLLRVPKDRNARADTEEGRDSGNLPGSQEAVARGRLPDTCEQVRTNRSLGGAGFRRLSESYIGVHRTPLDCLVTYASVSAATTVIRIESCPTEELRHTEPKRDEWESTVAWNEARITYLDFGKKRRARRTWNNFWHQNSQFAHQHRQHANSATVEWGRIQRRGI